MSKKKYSITAILYDKRGSVLSIGKNSYIKTHTYQAKLAKQLGMEQKQFLHAEIAAIIRCRHLERAYKIAVFRFDVNGKPANSSPCRICQQAIKEAGIIVVEHT